MDELILWPRLKRLEKAKESGGMGFVEAGNTVFPRTTITFENGGYITDKFLPFEKGKRYALTIRLADGSYYDTFTATAEAYIENEVEYGASVTWSVSLKKENGDVAGYLPFVATSVYPEYQELLGGATIFVFGMEDSGVFGVSIEETETIHQIDPKFIPGAVLPVVELSTVVPITGTPVQLSEAESALLDTAYQSRVPIVCNITIANLVVSVPLVHVGGEVSPAYGGASALGNLTLSKNDAGWAADFAVAER